MNRSAASQLLILCVTSVAWCNGAMGLALEMFEFRTWIVYVASMLVLEAWMIGRWMGLTWQVSLTTTFFANVMTAFLCPVFITPILHYPLVGSLPNPKPFGNAVARLTVFGIVSACLEVLFWLRFAEQRGKKGVIWRTLLAHIAGIPLALAILLIPPQPYEGLEATAEYSRRLNQRIVMSSLQDDLNNGEAFPAVNSAEDLMRHYHGTQLTWGVTTATVWTLAYLPANGRFDTGENRSKPYELNSEVIGKRAQDFKKPTWLIRIKLGDGTPTGYRIIPDLAVGGGVSIARTELPERLGY